MSDDLTTIKEVIHRHMKDPSRSQTIGSVVGVGKRDCRYPIIQQICDIILVQVKFSDYFN